MSQREVNELARLRRQAIQDLQAAGLTYAQIGEMAGLTRGRIHQIRHGGPPPEAAFFGTGRITIVTPLKQDKIKDRPVVAMEDVAGAQRLAELVRSMGLEADFDHVPVGGSVDLNRPNLIVICGPRLSKPVARVLAQDPRVQFKRAKDGVWTLVDQTTATTYRSGQDEHPPQATDVAYLGRLPRPDGRGSLIVFTGIHPPGSLGVVHLLSTDLSEIYADAKTRTFSTIVGTDYDPTTTEPKKVQRLTPLYPIGEAA